MNVLTVGFLSIALYTVFVVFWLRYDKNKDGYADQQEKRS